MSREKHISKCVSSLNDIGLLHLVNFERGAEGVVFVEQAYTTAKELTAASMRIWCWCWLSHTSSLRLLISYAVGAEGEDAGGLFMQEGSER